MSLLKISISPESPNYDDNKKNIAYLYRGYYIWQSGESGVFDAWNFAPAVLVTPDSFLGETFDPYWDDAGASQSAETRRACIAIIDRKFADGTARPATRRNAWGRRPEAPQPEAPQPEAPQPEAPQPDPDAVENVTLTVSLNQARAILAALDRRVSELEALGGVEAESLASEAREAYQSVDRQAFCHFVLD